MWCELALNLGGTVAELQRRMSFAEFQRWIAYRNAHGPMDFSRKYDRPAALQAVVTRGGSMADFLPYDKPPETSIDDLFKGK